MSTTPLFDITERERTEQALRESEQRWQFALEGSGDGVWDWNLSTNQVVYSRRWKEMLGYAEHEITNHADEWTGRIHPDDQDQVFRNLNRHLSGEMPDYEAEHRLRCRDGSYKWILTRGMVMERDAEGKPLRIIGTHSDISARKQVEEELRHSRDRLEAANAELARAGRLKDEFLASMSHELRTPLTAILGLTEALREAVYGPVTQAQQTPLRMIEDSGRHLLALINDILDLAKIEAGQVELDLTPCELTEIGQASLHLVKGMAAKKRQQLAFAVTPPALMARVDGRRLKQMLANLLSNAVKFTPEGGRIGLEITGDQDAGVVRMTVWDTGIGIAAEDMPRLFQTFVQLDGRLARQYEGTGLGLALVKRMAELHGGQVSVESTPGQGSRFTLTLPWTPLAMVASGAVDIEHGAPTVAPAAPALILLAEDNDLNRIAYARYLQVKGFRVAEAVDGLEAVGKARALKPDLILMDIQMPGLSGLEAIQQLRADADPALARVPIIALTALAMPGDRERCLAAGADEYLSKPVGLRDLLEAVVTRLKA